MPQLIEPALELPIYRFRTYKLPLLQIPFGRVQQKGLGLVTTQTAVGTDQLFKGRDLAGFRRLHLLPQHVAIS